MLFLETLGENLLLNLFQLLVAAGIPWCGAPLLQHLPVFTLPSITEAISLCRSLLKTLDSILDPIWIV